MDKLRTFGIVAHVDAGKTTLTERILFDAGAQSWVGSVDEGTASTDWLPEERARGISIMAAAARVSWRGHELQIVDTPGHVDFVAEVERSLHVVDAVVVVVDATKGIESQTRLAWEQAAARHLPRAIFVNKLDRPGADFAACMVQIEAEFRSKVAPVVVPLCDAAGRFGGLVHAGSGAVQWFGGAVDESLRLELRSQASAASERLLEVAADCDERILVDLVGGRRVDVVAILAALRSRFRASEIVPVFAGAALWNQGVDWLLDGIVDVFPGAESRKGLGLWAVDRAGDPDAPLASIVFKVHHHEQVWNYLRIVRGSLRPGDVVGTARLAALDGRVPEVWVMQADRHRAVPLAGPGEIVVVPGDHGWRTGDSVCAAAERCALPSPKFPQPVLSMTLEPLQSDDLPRLWSAARGLAMDDPTLRVDRADGRVRLRGMGELHLEIAIDRIRRSLPHRFSVSRPRVERRATVRQVGIAACELRALVAGVERSAFCRIQVAPLELGVGVAVDFEPAAVTAAAELRSELESLAASGAQLDPLLGVGVRVLEARGDAGGVVAPLLQQAATQAFHGALARAGVRLLTSVVELEVACPNEAVPVVLADLASRGAQVGGVSSGAAGARIVGRAQLEPLLGYVTKLRSLTRGLGTVAMRPAGFEPAD